MFARTQRLLLRPGWAQDAPALQRGLADEGIVRNLARVPWPYGLDDARAFLASERRPDEASLLIFRRTGADPELIGSIGFARGSDGERELGYWIARPHWGRGYATEAGRAVVDIAHNALRLPRLKAAHFMDNPASGRVLHKLGFRPTGRVASQFSAGRNASVPCRLFELDLASAEAEPEVEKAPVREMVAA